MTATVIRLTNVKSINSANLNELTKQEKVSLFTNVSLCWRKDYLFVTLSNDNCVSIPASENLQWLQNCLKASRIKAICLDINLDELVIKHWADACEKARKPVFIRVAPSKAFRQQQATTSWQAKRALDVITSVIVLASTIPCFFVLALLISLSSPGPIFYRQWRVGHRGQLFKVWKFRTMVANAEASHHDVMGCQNGLHKCKNDPRITKIGQLMRKYSLDELPQLINVVRGEMSIVGPRPWALYDAIRIKKADRHRLRALPGITGAWQISGRSLMLDLENVSKIDLEYLQDWSLWKDFQIMLATIPKVLTGFGAF